MSSDIDAGEMLDRAIRERDRLNVVIAFLAEQLGVEVGNLAASRLAASGTSTNPTAPGKLRSDSFFSMSTPDAVKKYLEIVKKPTGPRDMADDLLKHGFTSRAKDFYTTLYTALRRLKKAGEVVNLDDGTWGLASWYPGRPKGGGSNAKKGNGDNGTNEAGDPPARPG